MPVAVQPLQPRGMAYDRTSTIIVMWGFKPGPGGQFVADELFDFRPAAAQQALVDICGRFASETGLKVFIVRCWPQDFREWLHRSGRPFPSHEVENDLNAFWQSAAPWVHEFAGFQRGGEPVAGGSGGMPAWLAVDFRVEVDSHSSGRQLAAIMSHWEEVAGRESDRVADSGAASSLRRCFPFSVIFVRAEAEMRVIGSALSSWLVSVGCALLAVVVFTQNCFLSSVATFAIFATAACSLFAITTVFQWEFGLMEAVSLIIFCGFSVDYPLHVVQAYVHERAIGAGIRQALQEVAGAVVAGCATTCGAAVFLLFCEIRIFTRFGLVLIVNMLFSLVFALVWIPAVIELSGRCKRRGLGDKVAAAEAATSAFIRGPDSPDAGAGPPAHGRVPRQPTLGGSYSPPGPATELSAGHWEARGVRRPLVL